MYEVLTAVFGLLVLFCIWKKKISDPRTMFFVWLLCFFCCLASCVLNRLYGNEMLSMSLIGWMIAILFLSQTFYEIRDNSQCCQQVPAEYTGYRTNYGGRHRFYVPVFSYEWEGKKYQERSAKTVSYTILNSKMAVGQTYTIYINPKKPYINILHRRLRFINFFFITLGLFFFLTSPLMFLAALADF